MSTDSRRDAIGAVLDERSLNEPAKSEPRFSPEPGSAAADRRRIVNALTVDVEAYVEVSALSERMGRGWWSGYPRRFAADLVLRHLLLASRA